MSQPVVLIVFYSRCGSTEKLALAAAVGAVQARALIRLRRIPDADAAATLKELPNCKEALVRMHREYVAPTENDILGADALILASSEGFIPASPEWYGYTDLLNRLASSGKLKLKTVGIVDCGHELTSTAFRDAITQMGLNTTSTQQSATTLGRETAQTARNL